MAANTIPFFWLSSNLGKPFSSLLCIWFLKNIFPACWEYYDLEPPYKRRNFDHCYFVKFSLKRNKMYRTLIIVYAALSSINPNRRGLPFWFSIDEKQNFHLPFYKFDVWKHLPQTSLWLCTVPTFFLLRSIRHLFISLLGRHVAKFPQWVVRVFPEVFPYWDDQ